MIFVDTNFFLRFLLKDVNSQFLIARELFLRASRKEVKLTTSLLVFFEIVWVLRQSYKKNKTALINVLEKILKLDIEIKEKKLLLQALNIFKKSTLTLEDCYNLTFSRQEGIKDLKTFDKKLLKNFKSLNF